MAGLGAYPPICISGLPLPWAKLTVKNQDKPWRERCAARRLAHPTAGLDRQCLTLPLPQTNPRIRPSLPNQGFRQFGALAEGDDLQYQRRLFGCHQALRQQPSRVCIAYLLRCFQSFPASFGMRCIPYRAVFGLEHAGSAEVMQALIQSLQDWLVDRPDLRRTFAHWISQTLIRNREYSIVLPEVHDLLELKVMLADTVEAWAHAYEARGEARGEAKGKAEGEMLLLQKLLTKRFGAIPAPITAQIASASLQDIERWFDLAIDANRLSDIFGE